MTTIAFDGKSLCADTRGTAGGFPFTNDKAYRLKDGRLYAGSGDAQDCTAVRLWLESGGDKPSCKDFVGMVIGADGSIWRYEDKLVPFQVTAQFHAIGSGRDYAIAAIHASYAVNLTFLTAIVRGANSVNSIPMTGIEQS